jgi:hypothetical protein
MFVVASVVAGVVGDLAWLIAVATLGTALGTLGLAYYTFLLARSTRQSVEGSQEMAELAVRQFGELQEQVRLARVQSDALREQAAAAVTSAAAAQNSIKEAAKARIDAIAPLLDMSVTALTIECRVDAGHYAEVTGDQQWHEAQLNDIRVRVGLAIELVNIGSSTAYINFPSYKYDLEGLSKIMGPRITRLPVGESYKDRLYVDFAGPNTANGELVHMVVQYHGPMHGDTSDDLHWRGWVHALTLAGGIARRAEWLLNAGPGSVIRSYPNIERPEEMAEVRSRVVSPSTQ